jgi:hypothetical protein
MSISHFKERTYAEHLAPLGGEPSVWAECRFVDPIGDIAVLGPPDDQELYDESNAYDGLVEAESVTPLTVAPPESEGWLLSLDGVWFRCAILHQKNSGGFRLAILRARLSIECPARPCFRPPARQSVSCR